MRKVIMVFLVSILAISSCKYEDGPKISLRTKNHRLINNWTIDKVYENGIDKTYEYKQFFFDYRLDIRKDKSYTVSNEQRGGSGRIYYEWGSWAFNEGKMEVVLTPQNALTLLDSLPRHWKIMRLKEKSLWMKGDITNAKWKVVDVHFK